MTGHDLIKNYGLDKLTIQTNQKNGQNIKNHDSVSSKISFSPSGRNMQPYRQKTNLTTLGIFRDGFLVSPAVIPRLSVPPTVGERA